MRLTPKQEEQVQAAVQQYDEQIQKTWEEFEAHLRQSIAVEALMLAAIEDGLSDRQRERLYEQRSRIHKLPPVKSKVGPEAADQVGEEERPEKDAAQPKAATELSEPETKTTDNDPEETPAVPAVGDKDADSEMTEESLAIVGVSLSPRQQEWADAIQASYAGRLRKLQEEKSSLHARLVALEAAKLTAVEKVLTEKQLDRVKGWRQQPPDSARKSELRPAYPAFPTKSKTKFR